MSSWLHEADAERDRPRLQRVYSKCDLTAVNKTDDADEIAISTVSGAGMDELIDRITGQAQDYNQDQDAFMARRRHVDALGRALVYLRQAAEGFAQSRSAELMAEDLRLAQQCLDEITGEFSSDDLLGKIFSSFCIGK